MGKNTVVTRREVRAYTLATGERDIGRENFGCPAAMRRRAPYWRARCQWAKTFWSRIVPGVSNQCAPFRPFWWVTVPEHTWSLFAGAEWAAGVVFRAVGITSIRP